MNKYQMKDLLRTISLELYGCPIELTSLGFWDGFWHLHRQKANKYAHTSFLEQDIKYAHTSFLEQDIKDGNLEEMLRLGVTRI